MRYLRLMLVVGLIFGGATFGAGKADAGATSCTPGTPGVAVDNNWGWGQSGSWGQPGQQLTYAVHVMNNDVGCSSSSFVISVTAPSGFTVSVPTNTISLKAASSAYLWAYITSPTPIADGDYAVTAMVQRVGTSTISAPYVNYYKVYSSDTTAPSLFWPNPDGGTISGRSYNVTVSSSDDHAVKKIDLYLDNVYRTTTTCDDISYICQLAYPLSLRGIKGPHTATFKSYDWMGNIGALTVAFTIG